MSSSCVLLVYKLLDTVQVFLGMVGHTQRMLEKLSWLEMLLKRGTSYNGKNHVGVQIFFTNGQTTSLNNT